MNQHRGCILALLASLLLVTSGAETGAAEEWETGLSVGYMAPRSDELSRLYDGSFCLHLFGARRISRPAGSIALEVGYFRSTADLAPPFFVPSAESELRWIPINLIARMELAQRGRLAPFLGAGFQLLYAEERFEYTIAGDRRTQIPDQRWDPGVLIVAGIDRRLPPRLRIEGFFGLAFAERRIQAGDDNHAIPGDGSFDAGSYGIRIAWRLP